VELPPTYVHDQDENGEEHALYWLHVSWLVVASNLVKRTMFQFRPSLACTCATGGGGCIMMLIIRSNQCLLGRQAAR
jgi:hypothetical protein